MLLYILIFINAVPAYIARLNIKKLFIIGNIYPGSTQKNSCLTDTAQLSE